MKENRGTDASRVAEDRLGSWGREMVAGGVLCAASAVMTLVRAPSVYAITWLGSDADRLALMYFYSMRTCLIVGMGTMPVLLCLMRKRVGVRDLALQLGLMAGLWITQTFSIVGNDDLRLLAPALFRPLAWCWNWRGVFFLDLFIRMLTLVGTVWCALALFRVCAKAWRTRRMRTRSLPSPRGDSPFRAVKAERRPIQ